MLDGIILLAVFLFGCWVVPKLLWKSYGHHFIGVIDGVAAGVRSLKAFTPWGPYRPDDDYDYDNQDGEPKPERPNERTNERHHVPQRTKLHQAADALQLDRTRKGLIRVMVAAGLNVSEIRGLIKGTATDIGDEIKEAKDALAREAAPLPADDPDAWLPGEREGTIVRVR